MHAVHATAHTLLHTCRTRISHHLLHTCCSTRFSNLLHTCCTRFSHHLLHTRYCTHAFHTTCCTHASPAFHTCCTHAAHTLLHTRYCTHATAHTGPTLPTLLRPNNVSRDNAPSWVTPRTRRLARPASTRWSRARTGLYDAALNATMPSGLPSTSRSW